MAPPAEGIRRVLHLLSVALVWAGAGIAAVLTIAAFAVDRVAGNPVDLATAAGVVAVLVLAGVLGLVMVLPRLKGTRRHLAACVLGTLLIFVTRPEGIVGGSVALVGGALGVLLEM